MDKSPQNYRDFRNLATEGRWSTPFHPYLHFELKNLEDDLERNKIDHPSEVAEIEVLNDGDIREIILMGSKDLADAVAGSVTRAIQKSISPPDIEIMTELMNKTNKPGETGIDRLWWLDSDRAVKKVENVGANQTKKANTTYLDILKKARNLNKGI
jgi:hypothetical protein